MEGFRMSDYPNGGGFSNANATAAAAADFDHVLMMNSFFAPTMSPASLQETQSLLDFNNAPGSRMPNFPTPEQFGFGINLTEYESDDSTGAAGEKAEHGCRKRLSVHQVRCLEKCFKVDSKLDPRRKSELARELGLKPRQVAIWFQNRRARHKNKQIEKDYDKVAGQYGMIKAQYDKVITENNKLKAQMKSMMEEMSLMKDSLLNYRKLMQAGLLDTQMMQTQPQVMQAQAEPHLMQQTQTELQQASDNPNEFNTVCNGEKMTEQRVQVQRQWQQVISPASSVFDSNSPVVEPQPKLLAHVVEAAEKRSAKLMECEQENSVNQDLPYDLPNLFELDEPNCFYSFQVDGPPFTPACDFGVIPAADDPLWQF